MRAANVDSRKKWVLFLVALILMVVTLLQEPFAQPQSYHLFADRRTWFSIPNLMDVLSNIPFALVGLMGIWRCARCRVTRHVDIFRIIFVGVFLTAFGSAYYHWQPSNQSLVWDRLPMTIAFMGFFTFVLADRVDVRCRLLLWPFLALGAASVFYWDWTEIRGMGDLRFYGLVQFLPLLLIPLILFLFPADRGELKYYVGLLLSYLLAKLLEHFDQVVWDVSGVVSGHSLKHLAAALGTYFIVLLLGAKIRDARRL